MEIEYQLEEGNVIGVEKMLEGYEVLLTEEDTIHFQYVDMIRAFLAWNVEQDSVDCNKYLEKAMSYTMAFWQQENVWEYPMTWREAGLLLLWAKRVKSEEELEVFFEEMLVYNEKGL